jgi:hypothetical protein
MTLEDIEIISAVFAGSAIREGFGKLSPGPRQLKVRIVM